jgi:hypothetical protein
VLRAYKQCDASLHRWFPLQTGRANKLGRALLGMSHGDVGLLVRTAYSDFLTSQLSGDTTELWCKVRPSIAPTPMLKGELCLLAVVSACGIDVIFRFGPSRTSASYQGLCK